MGQKKTSRVQDATRLQALLETGLLDSPAEEAFDRITRLASRVLRVPVALISLVAHDRQFFKSAVGLPEPWASARQTPLTHSFCQFAVESGKPLVVRDAREHPILRDNLAVADLNVIAYAGLPLVNCDGHALGVLCAIDGKPRDWSADDESILREFADLVTSAIESRSNALRQIIAVQSLRDAEEKFKAFMDHSPTVAYMKDEDGRMLYVNQATYRFFPEAKQWLGRTNEELFPPEVAQQLRANDLAAVAAEGGISSEECVPSAAGQIHHWMTFKFPVRQADGRVLLGGISVNINDRKAAELALRESEDRFRHLVAGVQDYAIFMLDTSGTVITWNDGAKRFKGYLDEEIIGQSFEVFYLPEDRDAGKPAESLRIAARDGLSRDVGWRVRKDGSRFYANVTITALRSDDGTLRGYAKFTRDVTQEREVADAKEVAERKVRAIYDSAFQFIGLLELDGTVVHANETAMRFINLPLSAVVGKPFWECPWWTHSLESQAMCRDAVRRAAAGEMVREQTTHIAADGQQAEMDFSLKPLRDQNGRITHLIPEGRDITSLHVAKAKLNDAHDQLKAANDELEKRVRDRTRDLESAVVELRQSESNFRFMTNAMPQIAWTAKPSGEVDFYNDRFLDYCGYTPEEALEWGWTRALHPDDLHGSIDRWAWASATGADYEVEYRFRRASDGEYRWHLGRAEPMRDENGNIIKWFGTCTDIDDQKRSRDDLAAQVQHRTEQLVKATRVAEAASEAKSRFLAHMSHEIRTPLTAIFGYTDLLLLPGFDDADRRNCVQTVRRNAEHLLAIINDILDLSKIEAGEMTVEMVPTNVTLLLGEIIPLLQQRAVSKGITLDVHFATSVPETIRSDPTRLRQILLNLIGNAIKFTSHGGVLVVLRFHEADEKSTLSIGVKDTGIGMTPSQSAQIFAPFVQADSSHSRLYGGTGLGLAISRQLAQLLNGDIECISEEGIGSVFTLVLPVVLASGVQRVSGLSSIGRPLRTYNGSDAERKFEGRILLAEDSLDNQRLISIYLQAAGATVEVVETGNAAFDVAMRARHSASPFDLVLMDCQMPEMDGYAATRKLRQAGYDRPIVALTANAMSHERAQCIAAGSDYFLTKPLQLDVFYRVVKSYLKESRRSGASGTAGSIQRLDKVVSELANDPLIRPLVKQFVTNMKVKVDAIEKAAATGDLSKVSHLAHQIKGEAGSYGFPTVTAAAESVERVSQDGQAAGLVRESVGRLVELCDRVSHE